MLYHDPSVALKVQSPNSIRGSPEGLNLATAMILDLLPLLHTFAVAAVEAKKLAAILMT